MANNAYYGYTPKKEEISAGSTGNRLDRINPYEFRKGMDYELTNIGCSRLAESSVEEREKATEAVLKNLEENHPAYYSGLIQYETEYRGRDKKPTFKQWIKEFYEENNMKEVGDTFKNDKMEELKETIKSKVRKMILENDELMDDETELDVDGIPVVDLDNDVEDVKEEEDEEAIAKKTAVKGAKGKAKQLKTLDKEESVHRSSNYLFQEYLPGQEYTVDVLCDLDSNPVIVVPRKRLQIKAGISSKGQVIKHKQIENLCKDLCLYLNLKGPVCIQLKEDSKGNPKFIEVNPRLGGGTYFSTLAGVNFLDLILKIKNEQSFNQPIFKEITVLRYYNEIVI